MVKSLRLMQKMGMQTWSVTVYIALILFLFLNIASSQSAPPYYRDLMSEKRQAVVSFLKAIRPLPEFHQLLITYKRKYRENLEKDIFAEKLQRDSVISELEEVLKKNSDARDVLYNLSVLYKQNGDEKKSQEYMEKAKSLDPTIN